MTVMIMKRGVDDSIRTRELDYAESWRNGERFVTINEMSEETQPLFARYNNTSVHIGRRGESGKNSSRSYFKICICRRNWTNGRSSISINIRDYNRKRRK